MGTGALNHDHEDRERLEEEEAWIEEHGPITGSLVPDAAMLRVHEADLPQVVESWPVLEPPLTPQELAAMPEAAAHDALGLALIEEVLRDAGE